MADATQSDQRPATEAEKRAFALLDELWNDKDVGSALRKRAKDKFPDISIPPDPDELLAPAKAELAAFREEMKKDREERDKEKKDLAEAKMKADMEASINQARKNYRLTDEGFEKMIARMKETGNYSDADAAAAWVASKAPPPPAPGPSWLPQKAGVPGAGPETDEKKRLLLSDPQGYADAELQEFVRDPDKYVAETFGQAA